MKHIPYEIREYYIKIARSIEKFDCSTIHLAKKEWLNKKYINIISQKIYNEKNNLASLEKSLDMRKKNSYNETSIVDLLEL